MYLRLIVVCLVLATLNAEKDYTDVVKFLKSQIENKTGTFYHSAYDKLAYITDTYGPRMWGSQVLEMVISEFFTMAARERFENIRLQPVRNFTKWVRGNQSLTLYSPRPFPQKLGVIGLGRSVPGNVKAEAIVIKSFAQLEQRKDEVKGKIVVYNEQWTNYTDSGSYRLYGAGNASKYGALAALVRSVASFSIYSVHTGIQFSKTIPTAAITVQDAEMMQRMQDRGQKIVLHLVLQNQEFENANSNNLVFEIKGTEKPDQIVLIGSHTDSWDTGPQTGANDAGGGFVCGFEAMRLILKSGLRPKRTLRYVAYSGQEFLQAKSGYYVYAQTHKDELAKHIVAFDDDIGNTQLLGFGYVGDPKGKEILQMIGSKYMSILNSSIVNDQGFMYDTVPMYEQGVPIMAKVVKDTRVHDFYFYYHHTAGDSMTMMNADDLDSNVVGIAAMFYILADLENTIPRPSLYSQKLRRQ